MKIIIYDWNIVLLILCSFFRTWHHILQTVSSMHLAWLAPRDSAVHTHSFASASQSPEKIIGIFGTLELKAFFRPNSIYLHSNITWSSKLELAWTSYKYFCRMHFICTVKILKSLAMFWEVVALILKRAAYA